MAEVSGADGSGRGGCVVSGVLTGCGGQPPPARDGGHERPSAGHLIGSAWHARSRRPPRQTERRDRCERSPARTLTHPAPPFSEFPRRARAALFSAERWPPLIDWTRSFAERFRSASPQRRRPVPRGPWRHLLLNFRVVLWSRVHLRACVIV